MKNLSHDLIRHISMFSPMGLHSVSRHLETAQIGCVLDLLKKLERENLVHFPFLEGLSIYPTMQYKKGPELVNLIHRKAISHLTHFQLFAKDQLFSTDPMHHLMARPDLNEILEPYQKLEDDSLLILTEVLRSEPNNFDIPISSAAEARGWFQEEANQLRLSLITRLNLSDKGLIHLPAELQFFSRLQILHLSSNSLKSLPASIGKFTALKSLHIHNNQLKSIPNSIGKLTTLKSLGLSSNKLEAIPTSIGKLTALLLLDLSENQLESLPASIGKLTALQELALHDNPLKSLPPSIYQLQNFSIFEIPILEEGAGGGGSKED